VGFLLPNLRRINNMDETNETTQDETNAATQDSSNSAGNAGGSGDGDGSSKETPRMFNEEEHRKLLSDALSKAGMSKKELETRETKLTDDQKKFQDTMDSWLSAEAEAAKEDPDELDVITRQKNLRTRLTTVGTREKDADRREEAVRDRETKADEKEAEHLLADVAKEKGIKTEDLKAKVEEYKITGKEQIESVADMIKSSTTTKVEAPSGKTVGGKTDYTSVQFGDNAPSAKEMIKAGAKKKE